jgi:hypothetical protein
MRILEGYNEALDYVKPFLTSNLGGSNIMRPPQIKGPWSEDLQAAENTLKYIFEHLHHNCYLVCSDGQKAEVSKLQSSSTAPTLRPYLFQKLNKTIRGKQRETLVKTLKSKQWRIMQCIVKSFKKSSDDLFPKFISEIIVPKGVYIFTLTDAQILREDGQEPWQMVTGSKSLGDMKFKSYLPLYAYSGQKGYWDIPIPTYDDLKLYFNPFVPPEVSWEKKMNKAVFRGGPTGCGYTSETNQRIKLATMRSESLDVGLTKTKSGLRFDPVHGLGDLDVPIQTVPRIEMEEQANYKYIIHVDGNVLAYRLLKSMLLGSVILRVKSPYIHWLDHVMKEDKHYILISADLSDLNSKLAWCLQNNAKCKKIAERAKKFATKALSKEFIKDYFEKYALKFS